MSSFQIIFPGIRSFLVFSSSGFKPLVFSLILTVASRLFHPYSTDDETPGFMVKRLSTVRDTQRVSQRYMEKRRGKREIEVTRRRRGESKGERLIYPVISFLSVLHSPEHAERFTELSRDKKEEGGDKVDLREKRERAIKLVITHLRENGY